MNVLQSLLGHIKPARLISEDEIRRDHTLQLCSGNDSTPADRQSSLTRFRQQLRRKWRRFFFVMEPRLAGAVPLHDLPESNLLVAHSSLTVAQGFSKARAIFKGSDYAIYCVAGDTDQIEPLFGRDSIIVFEKVGPGTLSRQPFRRGDIVISHSNGVRSLQRINNLDETRQEFTADQADRGAISSIESRLVAVFYTCLPDQTGQTPDHLSQPTLLTPSWEDAVFQPARGDKPTPHSAVALWGTELDRARRVFPWPAYSVYTDIRNTNSMEPLLDSGTAVIFEALSEPLLLKQPLRPGDIVTWGTPSHGALHRIVGQAEGGASFYIRGDNNRYGDSLNGHSLIPRRLIIRRAVAIIYGRQIRQND